MKRTPGNTASLKRLIFEFQTLVCNELKLEVNTKDDSAHAAIAGPERDARVQQQKDRLTGLRFRGEEECGLFHLLLCSFCCFTALFPKGTILL